MSAKNVKITPEEGGVVPQICFDLKSYFFCELKPHAKFQNPRTPSMRKVTGSKGEKRERGIGRQLWTLRYVCKTRTSLGLKYYL